MLHRLRLFATRHRLEFYHYGKIVLLTTIVMLQSILLVMGINENERNTDFQRGLACVLSSPEEKRSNENVTWCIEENSNAKDFDFKPLPLEAKDAIQIKVKNDYNKEVTMAEPLKNITTAEVSEPEANEQRPPRKILHRIAEDGVEETKVEGDDFWLRRISDDLIKTISR